MDYIALTPEMLQIIARGIEDTYLNPESEADHLLAEQVGPQLADAGYLLHMGDVEDRFWVEKATPVEIASWRERREVELREDALREKAMQEKAQRG